MKVKLILIFLFIVFLTGNLFALDRSRKIKVGQNGRHPVLTQSLYNETLLMDEPTKRIVYVSYISGFVDAMQLNAIKPNTAKKFIDDCSGLTLGDLQDMTIKFKNENSLLRGLTPAYTLIVVIPRIKKGLTNLPVDIEEKELFNN